MCSKKYLPLFFALLLLSAPVGLWADGTVTPLPVEMQSDPWANFDNLWQSLKDELTGSEADWQELSKQLDALQTEASALKSSLTESTGQLGKLEKAIKKERICWIAGTLVLAVGLGVAIAF